MRVWEIVLGVAAGLVLVWALLVVAVWRGGRKLGGQPVGGVARLVPDVIRLIGRLARDPGTGLGVRLGLLALLVYLASPIDVVPDFVPVLGYADDAVIVALALRLVVRHCGPEAVRANWPGTPEGLQALLRLAGLPQQGGIGTRGAHERPPADVED